MMINVTLPNFYKNCKAIDFIYGLSSNVFKLPVTFSAATGNFPYCYWNGGYNNCIGNGVFYKEIVNFSEDFPCPIRFNCANVNITECDFEDALGNLILQLNDNGSNSIEVSDLKFCEFLAKKYEHYRFVFSKEAEMQYQLAPEMINGMANTGLFSIIALSESKTLDFDFLSQIKDKSIIEVQISATCDILCRQYAQCKKQCHDAQFDFSNKNNFTICSKRPKEAYAILTADDITNKYLPIGINHFSIGEFTHNVDGDLISLIVDLFVKDECKVDVLKQARSFKI